MQARQLELCLDVLTSHSLGCVCRALGLPDRGARRTLCERITSGGADPVLASEVAQAVQEQLAVQRAEKRRRRGKRPLEQPRHVRSLLPQFDSVATDERGPRAPPPSPVAAAAPCPGFFSPEMLPRAVPPFSPPRYTPQF